ncbi:hypothetical protein M413DRAFT_6276 [Hebeloma cylindrosporum]|uniref:Aspartic peptidase DDI1-type domain-containing protein n=1 Tax=Hebeloma cylindrosporum TaxID=76867 RepID=A0A0C2YHA3_HEBCY|nr:hypothetical protein M413DRAFT_6276 [Hebeloma cylindrosporum h7]
MGIAYARQCADGMSIHHPKLQALPYLTMGLMLEDLIADILYRNQPYWLDDVTDVYEENRFKVSYHSENPEILIVRDNVWEEEVDLPMSFLQDEFFDLPNWYNDQIPKITKDWLFSSDDASPYAEDDNRRQEHPIPNPALIAWETIEYELELNGVQIPQGTYPAVQRNAASVKARRVVPKPIVITVKVNGHPARALLDSGSLGDFMSSTLADQLQVSREKLDLPLGLQLAVQGSRSKINAGAKAKIQYEGIDEHQICVGFNPARVIVGNDISQELKGSAVTNVAQSSAVSIEDDELAEARILRRAASKTFRSSMDGKDAYEQIRVDPDHVERTAMTTPDGNMTHLKNILNMSKSLLTSSSERNFS